MIRHSQFLDYPREILPVEAGWGFELYLIEGIVDLTSAPRQPELVPVVAKILTRSDILLKVFELKRRVMYSHRRFGHYRKVARNIWTPLSHLQPDLRQFIFDFNAGSHDMLFGQEIVPARFKFRKAQ